MSSYMVQFVDWTVNHDGIGVLETRALSSSSMP